MMMSVSSLARMVCVSFLVLAASFLSVGLRKAHAGYLEELYSFPKGAPNVLASSESLLICTAPQVSTGVFKPFYYDLQSGSKGFMPMNGSNPHDFLFQSTCLYFVANHVAKGEEVWVVPLDQKSYSPYLAYDLQNGSSGSSPRTLVPYTGVTRSGVLLSANVEDKGRELVFLYRQNLGGTLFDQKDVNDIRAGANGSDPQHLTHGRAFIGGAWKDTVYFSADNGTNGRELYRFHLTGWDNVYSMHDLNPGAGSSTPKNFTLSGNVMYFAADNGSAGEELWRDNGQGNIQMVKDIVPGSVGSFPKALTPFGAGSIYFLAYTSATGYELWKSDGTESGTVMVKEIRVGSGGDAPGNLVYDSTSGYLYFQADDGISGMELWRSNGTAAGTVRVKDIAFGAAGSNPSDMMISRWSTQSRCYFTADAEGDNNRMLWISDATDAGTLPLANFPSLNAAPRHWKTVESDLYLVEGATLYKYYYEGAAPAAPDNVWLEPLEKGFICNWSDNADNETGYRLEYSPGDQPPVGLIADTPPDRFSHTFGKMTDNTQYSITVRAFNDIGFSNWPTPAYVTGWTLSLPPKADPPYRNLQVIPAPSSETWLGSGSVQVFPLGGFGDEPGKVSAYRVRWNRVQEYYFDGTEPVWNSGGAAYGPGDSGSYYLHFQALNAVGTPNPSTLDWGPFLFDVNPPSAPGSPAITQFENGELKFSWTAAADDDGGSGVASYRCRIGTTAEGDDVYNGNVGTALSKNFKWYPGETYYARVWAVDNVGHAGPEAAVTPFVVPGSGSLKVSVSPPAIIFARSEWWRRKGTETWRNHNEIEENVFVGDVTVEFKEFKGWLTPLDKTVAVVADTQTTTSGAYVRGGTLTILIEPEAARTAGAQWRRWRYPLLPQLPWLNSGATEDVVAGDYDVEFKSIAGWDAPASIPVVIASNDEVTETGTYIQQETGSLSVDIQPDEAVAAGAQWRRVGTETWLDDGQEEPLVKVGSHIIEFKPVVGWKKPDNETVTVVKDMPTELQSSYTKNMGALQVTLEPAEAIASGAQWRRAEWLSDPLITLCEPYEGAGLPAVFDGSVHIFYLDVDAPGLVTDINVSLDLVNNDNLSEMQIILMTPDAEEVILSNYSCDGAMMTGTTFDDDAETAISDGVSPYSGVYTPYQSLSAFNGIPASGEWGLAIYELYESGTGYETTLNGWSLCVTTDEMEQELLSGNKLEPGPWLNSGDTEEEVPAGLYRLEFMPLTGWTAPGYTVANVLKNQTETVEAAYAKTGTLQVLITPGEAVDAGAQWRRTGTELWLDSGSMSLGLDEGDYEVEFKSVDGWTVPENTTVAVFSDYTTVLEQEYRQPVGYIVVNITPDEASDAGAEWQIDGTGVWWKSGTIQELPLGQYTVSFKALSGWETPENAVALLDTSDETINLTGAYVEIPAEGEGEVPVEGEGEILAEGEGEIPAEGEGEIPAEGEGEIPAEGEGETPVEGEGEVPAEGEGEIPAEGEGEVPAEGEGEIPAEGEGETPLEGEGEIPAEGEGETPVEGEGEVPAEGEGEIPAEGEGEASVEGEGEIPAEGEGETPLEGEGEIPAEGEGEIPAEGEGETPVEGEGEVPAEGEGEIPAEGEGEAPVEGEGEVLPEGEGEVLPEGEGEVLPEGEGEILPEGEGEILPEGESEGEEEDDGCGCGCNKNAPFPNAIKRTLGDFLLLGVTLAVLFGVWSTTSRG